MKPLAEASELEPEPAGSRLPMCGQGPDRGAAEPEPGCGLATDGAELDGALPDDVVADVELDELPVAPAAPAAEPPEVAASATPAPAASPATATAPPIASRRSAPTDLSPDMIALLLCV